MNEAFIKQINFVNSLSKEEIEEFSKLMGMDVGFGKDVQVEATVKIHNGINLEIIGENLKGKEFFKNIKELPI